MTCIATKTHTHTHTQKTATWPPRQRLEECSFRPRKAKDYGNHQKPGREHGPADTWCRTAGLQHCERTHLRLKAPVCGTSLGSPRELVPQAQLRSETVTLGPRWHTQHFLMLRQGGSARHWPPLHAGHPSRATLTFSSFLPGHHAPAHGSQRCPSHSASMSPVPKPLPSAPDSSPH